MANGGGDLWMLMTVAGVAVLGAAILYGMMRNRSMTGAEKRLSEKATDDVYEAEQRDPANRSA
jgi:hypothetical protein